MSSAVVGDPYLRLMPQDSRCWIYHLPTELLVQIFRIVYDCVPDDGKRHFPELSISHVSKLWRDIAINLPTLWTAFDFPDDLRHNKAAIYLERSKRAPLEIVITLDGGEGKADARTTTELLEKLDATMTLVIPHITRWNSLDIMAFDYSFIHPTLIQLGACVGAPMLEVLRISNYALNPSEGVGEEFKRQDFVLFHGNVPSLKCVDLVGVHVNWTTSIFLSGLKELHLSCHAEDLRPLFKDFAHILRSSPELEKLSFSNSGPAGSPVEWRDDALNPDMIQTDHIADPVIHLPSLRSLEIASPEYGHICLIERLALPNLVSLSVGAIHRPQDVYFPVCGLGDVGGTVLLKALARPSPVTGRSVFSKLREINLTRIGCDDEAAIAYMFTELTELLSLSLDDELAIMDWEDVLIKQWESIAHSNKEPLLPKLETFKTTRLSSESARELIQARKATGKPFKKASMGRTSVFTKEDEQWIRDHVDIFEHHDGLLGKVVLKTEI